MLVPFTADRHEELVVECLTKWLARLRDDSAGAVIVEYALLVAFVALIAIAAINVVGLEIANLMDYVGETFADSTID